MKRRKQYAACYPAQIWRRMLLELGDVTWPEVTCPYCYEDHGIVSLCLHLQEEHPYEPHTVKFQ